MTLLVIVAGIFASEAEKEVRILCSMFEPGSSLARVEEILDTGNLLHISTEVSGEYRHLEISSWFNLRLTGCSVQIDRGFVTDSAYRPTPWSS